MSIFFGTLSLILFILSLPGTMYLFLIVWFGRKTIDTAETSASPHNRKCNKLGILIPAHNEEMTIEGTLKSLQQTAKPSCDIGIFVIADNCTDNTGSLAQDFGAKVLIREDKTLIGKGYALDFGFKAMLSQDYELILVIDADTRCSKNILIELVSKYQQGYDVLQVLNTIVPEKDNPYSQLTNLGFYAMNVLRPLAREEMGFSAGIFGTGFAVSKAVLIKCPYKAFSLIEDVQYHHLLIDNDIKSHLLKTARVFSSVPRYSSTAKTQRNRWEGGKLKLLIDYFPALLDKVIRGEKRFLDPLLEITLLPISYHVLLVSLSLLLSGGTTFLILYATLSIGLTFYYMALAWKLSESNKTLIELLFLVPGYLFWKLRNIDGLLRNIKTGANWIRTGRD